MITVSTTTKKFLYIIAIALFFLYSFLKFESFPGHEELKDMILMYLTRTQAVPVPLDASSGSDNVIYVMGGYQGSLIVRFQTASELYKRGATKKIQILSRPGITEYNPPSMRNLTNDEWAILKLTERGVEKKDVEPISIKKEFFGTLSEAKWISKVAVERRYKGLVVVTSSYHAKRVYESFSRFLEGHNVNLYVYTAQERIGLRGVLDEFFKLMIYRAVLLN